MKESFGKREKLKSKKLIDSLFLEGKSLKNFPLKLVYIPISNPSDEFCKTGVSVPKKLVKLAVNRNRLKRLMREAFRKKKSLIYQQGLPKFALMFIYISREECSYLHLSKKMEYLLKKLVEKESP